VSLANQPGDKARRSLEAQGEEVSTGEASLPSQSRVAGLAKASGPGRSAAEPWDPGRSFIRSPPEWAGDSKYGGGDNRCVRCVLCGFFFTTKDTKDTMPNIGNQEEHYVKMSFKEELARLLKTHRIKGATRQISAHLAVARPAARDGLVPLAFLETQGSALRAAPWAIGYGVQMSANLVTKTFVPAAKFSSRSLTLAVQIFFTFPAGET